MKTQLYLSLDRKTKFGKYQRNSFGLPPVKTCPYATFLCKRHCYVHKVNKLYKRTSLTLWNNFYLLKRAKSVKQKANLLLEMLREFKEKSLKHKEPLYFRWHWSGDIFSQTYAKAIAIAIKETPEIKHWLYSRSFRFLLPLLDCKNLILYISIDKNNFQEGLRFFKRFKGKTKCKLLLAYMGYEKPISKDIRFIECPADSKKIKTEFACSKCRICTEGKRNVFFKIK